MREYELLINDAFKNGLSPEEIVPFNSQFLSSCIGFRIGKAGIEVYKELTNPLLSTFNVKYLWPFPQFFSGEGYNFLIIRDTVNQEDAIYLVSADHQTITHLFSIDELTFGKGTLMEVADFGKYAIMMNGVGIVHYDVGSSTWINIAPNLTIPLLRTICNFKGQLFGGGVTNNWNSLNETFYVWSRISSKDFTIDKENESGFRRCPYGGNIYHVRKLGNNLVGYSSKGITLITPVSDPITTFGFKESNEIGIINRGAVGGNNNRHIYVGLDYQLREVTEEGIKELGYSHHIEQLAGRDIIVSYNFNNKDFYISNGIKTFLLSSYGLSEISQHPNAVWRGNILPDTVDEVVPCIVTEPYNFEYAGQKTIFSLESDMFPVEDIQMGVDSSFNMKDWKVGSYKPLNDQGIVTNIVAGNSFKFKVKFNILYENMKLGYLKIRYKMTDLRGIRGVKAPGLRGQNAN